jgi:hypothetical protein
MNKFVSLKAVLDDVLSALANTNLLPGESMDEFLKVQAAILAELNPQSISEAILSSEFISCVWENKRYRKARDNLLISTKVRLLRDRLSDLLRQDSEAYEKLGEDVWEDDFNLYERKLKYEYLADEAQSKEVISYFLNKYKISEDEVIATSMAACLDQIIALEKTIAAIVRRRDKVLSDLEARQEQRDRLNQLADKLAEAG